MVNVVRAPFGALLFVLAYNAVAAAAPLAAEPQHHCSVVSASAFRVKADGYREHEDFARAARWYEAAAHAIAACADAESAITGARSLLQAATAVSEAGDYVRALALVRQAHARLRVPARDGRSAEKVQALADIADELTSAISSAAKASM